MAKHLGLDEYRAIKRVPKDGAEPFAEAAVLKNLRHPGIPVVYDLEEDFYYYYLIEEYLDGESLYACLRREGSLTKAKRISYGIELCRILYYLHSFEAYPILYLDLQPHNLLICQGTLKLIDFDQAASGVSFACTDKRFGTRGFAAPEQYTGEIPDVRTDIYAIGALLFYMGTGHAPEEGVQSLKQDGLDAVIWRCLQPDREKRYQNVREVLEELCKLQAGAFTAKETPLLTLAVAGSSHGMGVTHVSLCAIDFFSQQGFSCLYRECNPSGAVRDMAGVHKQKPDSYGIYHMKNRAMRPQYGPNVCLEEPCYEIIIMDFGTELQAVLETDYDILLLLCGGKDWELLESISSIRRFAGEKNLRVIFSHVSPDDILILPGDITTLHLFYLPTLSLSGSRKTESSFWYALFQGTPAEEVLGRQRKPVERRSAVCTFLKRVFGGWKKNKKKRIR